MKRLKFIGALLLGSVVLTACQNKHVTAPEPQGATQWLNDASAFTDSSEPNELSVWQYSAKVGLTVQAAQAKLRKEQANLIWTYDKALENAQANKKQRTNEVRLFGPLGVGTVKLSFDENEVQLSDGKGVLHHGASAQNLLTDVVGWPLPIDALSHWLFVQPSPNSDFQYHLNAQGQVAAIRQLGWQIEFHDYRNYGERILPRKLLAFKQFKGKQQGRVEVKLITKQWQW